MTKCTQAQLNALYTIYQRWQNKTPHAIMPDDFEIIPDEDYRNGDYIGMWVGGPVPMMIIGTQSKGLSSAIYLGVEKDGHTHS